MNLPVLGSLTLSGFAHRWYFAFLLAIAGLVTLYVFMQLIRRKRILRFASMELLESVAPNRPTRWRHLPRHYFGCRADTADVAMAGPTRDVRTPRNRAVVMLVIDVSQSMRATDVSPSRLAAAQAAAKQFADELTPGVNLGLISYAGTPAVLVSPTTNRGATKAALDKLQVADRTATGEAIFTALQAIATVGAVIGGGDTRRRPASYCFPTARRPCRRPQQPEGGVHRSSRSQGSGHTDFHDFLWYTETDTSTSTAAPTRSSRRHDDEEGCPTVWGTAYSATTLQQLADVYATLQQQIGFRHDKG